MSVNEELGSGTLDWKAFDKGSEEFKIYYYQRQREGFYYKMGLYHKVCPEHKTIRYWRSLPEDKQKAMLDVIMEDLPLDFSLNLDDTKLVGHRAFMIALIQIDNLFIRTEKPAKVAKKLQGPKPYWKAPSDALLRRAIQNHQIKS